MDQAWALAERRLRLTAHSRPSLGWWIVDLHSRRRFVLRQSFVIGSLLSQIRKIILLKKMRHQATAIFVVGILIGILGRLLSIFKGQSVSSINFTAISGTALYSALIWFLVCWFVSLVGRWLNIGNHRRDSYG